MADDRDQTTDLLAALEAVAQECGLPWRAGDDPRALLRALEEAAGELPGEVLEALSRVMDAAGALEQGLADHAGDD